MRRIAAIARVVIRTNFTYRERWVSLAFSALLPVTVAGLMIGALSGSSAGGKILEALGETDIGCYYIIVSVIVVLSQVLLHEEISLRVREGTFSSLLLLPLSGIELLLGCVVGNISFVWPAAVAIFAGGYILLGMSAIGVSSFAAGILLVSGCIILQAILSALIGTGAFWFVHTSGVFAFGMLVFNFLGGMIVPLEVLPSHVQQLARVLPFRFVYSSPAHALIGDSSVAFVLGMQFVWIIILGGLLGLLWRWGLRSYDATGG